MYPCLSVSVFFDSKYLFFADVYKFGAILVMFSDVMMIQMVDRPNMTPIGQDKKTMTFKALL